MGTWGAGLYQSDHALDLKAEIETLLTLPLELEEILGALHDVHGESVDVDHEGHTEFWLVLQDQFHTYGIDARDVAERALGIIEDGLDLAVWRDLEADEATIRRRDKALRKLTGKWAESLKRPRKRKIIKELEPYCLNDGDIVGLPYSGRWSMPSDSSSDAAPDGWGAFVVLRRFRLYQALPRYAIAQLTVDAPKPPSLDACLSSDIDHMVRGAGVAPYFDPPEAIRGEPQWDPKFVERMAKHGLVLTEKNAIELLRSEFEGGDGTDWDWVGEFNPSDVKNRARLLIFFHGIPKEKLNQWKAEPIGRVDLDEEEIRKDFPFVFEPNIQLMRNHDVYFRFDRKDGPAGPRRLPDIRCPLAKYLTPPIPR